MLQSQQTSVLHAAQWELCLQDEGGPPTSPSRFRALQRTEESCRFLKVSLGYWLSMEDLLGSRAAGALVGALVVVLGVRHLQSCCVSAVSTS